MSSSSSSGSCSPRPWCDEPLVGELALGVVVAPVQQGVARQPLEVPPVLLGVLAVVALGAGQAEHPLLEDRVPAVPQGQPEAELVADVRDAGHPVLVPPVRARAGVVVGEGPPGVAVRGVVLAHGAPGALAEVGAPLVPGVGGEQVGLGAAGRLGQPRVLGGGRRGWGVVHSCHCTPTAPVAASSGEGDARLRRARPRLRGTPYPGRTGRPEMDTAAAPGQQRSTGRGSSRRPGWSALLLGGLRRRRRHPAHAERVAVRPVDLGVDPLVTRLAEPPSRRRPRRPSRRRGAHRDAEPDADPDARRRPPRRPRPRPPPPRRPRPRRRPSS